MNCVIFHISIRKHAWRFFLQEIRNLYFTFENLAVNFLSWYIDYFIFHLWISVNTFSYMNMEFCISHARKFEHTFSWLKYGILYIFYVKISIKVFWHGICNSLQFKYENLIQIFNHQIVCLHTLHIEIWVQIILHEIWYILHFK